MHCYTSYTSVCTCNTPRQDGHSELLMLINEELPYCIPMCVTCSSSCIQWPLLVLVCGYGRTALCLAGLTETAVCRHCMKPPPGLERLRVVLFIWRTRPCCSLASSLGHDQHRSMCAPSKLGQLHVSTWMLIVAAIMAACDSNHLSPAGCCPL